MKKIFILTGEPSGDKLASTIISKLKKNNSNIEYLSVGGMHLNSLGIKSIYDLKEVTYIGFTSVLFNIFKIKKKINETVKKIIEFKPDILFSVDSPDFTLRIAEKVKKINPNIKIIHFVAPQVWVWRENRVKKLKNFLDHILLLFPFEKKYFDKENIPSTFIGHPLLETVDRSKIDISQIIKNHKKIISIFPGSRRSEVNILLPILINFIKMMNNKHKDIFYVFHSTSEFNKSIQDRLLKEGFTHCGSISDEK
jgi:Lipid A disaccharide synthetase